MLKIMFPLMMILFKMKSFIMTFYYMIFIMLFMLVYSNSFNNILNMIIMQDNISNMLMLLTLVSTILIMISSQNFMNISTNIVMILIILMFTFSINNMIIFYILFELVLIPTMILIMKSGKQPQRLQASIYLMMYTISASLPLFINIILMMKYQFFMISSIILLKINMSIFILLAFLVKMPMFFTHLWLPKAHVEAPLEGSMILAAILLKLGGYGLIRFIPLCINKINKMNYWIISISLMGATITSMNCVRQKDLKSLIAYSSVSHMGFVLMAFFSMNNSGLLGGMFMMIAHGLVSSALFLLVNDLYFKYHTRNIMNFKGIMSISPNIIFWWFIFMAMNMSAPPTINTISEIFIMTSMIFWNKYTMIMIFISSMMVTSFSMMMFLNLSHNKNELMFSQQSLHKTFLSLFFHMIPLILILMKMELF